MSQEQWDTWPSSSSIHQKKKCEISKAPEAKKIEQGQKKIFQQDNESTLKRLTVT